MGKNSSIEHAMLIGICEGILYRFLTPLVQALAHIEFNPCELSPRRFGHPQTKFNSEWHPRIKRRL